MREGEEYTPEEPLTQPAASAVAICTPPRCDSEAPEVTPSKGLPSGLRLFLPVPSEWRYSGQPSLTAAVRSSEAHTKSATGWMEQAL